MPAPCPPRPARRARGSRRGRAQQSRRCRERPARGRRTARRHGRRGRVRRRGRRASRASLAPAPASSAENSRGKTDRRYAMQRRRASARSILASSSKAKPCHSISRTPIKPERHGLAVQVPPPARHDHAVDQVMDERGEVRVLLPADGQVLLACARLAPERVPDGDFARTRDIRVEIQLDQALQRERGLVAQCARPASRRAPRTPWRGTAAMPPASRPWSGNRTARCRATASRSRRPGPRWRRSGRTGAAR